MRINDAAFSYSLYIFLQVGKIKVTAKQGLEMFRTHCQKYDIKMTNEMRKVRKGSYIFDLLIFVRFISDTYFCMELIWCLHCLSRNWRLETKDCLGEVRKPMGTHTAPKIGKMRFGSCAGEVAFPPSSYSNVATFCICMDAMFFGRSRF